MKRRDSSARADACVLWDPAGKLAFVVPQPDYYRFQYGQTKKGQIRTWSLGQTSLSEYRVYQREISNREYIGPYG